MGRKSVRIYDTSLRDGLRNSGIAIEIEDKVRFLQQLERLGVSDVEVGFGGPAQVETMKRLAEAVSEPVLYGLSRVNRRDLDRVLTTLAAAAHPGANIFSPTSMQFLEYAGKSQVEALDDSVKAVDHAKAQVSRVVFSAQDAPNADRSFLVELLSAVIAAGATAISLADTTSQALPGEFGQFCGELRDTVAGGHDVLWSVHCHDGMGLAAANCIAAIEHGARQVECTVNGIGEAKSGSNMTMQSIARILTKRADAFPNLMCNLDMDELDATERLLAGIMKMGGDRNSGVVQLLQRK